MMWIASIKVCLWIKTPQPVELHKCSLPCRQQMVLKMTQYPLDTWLLATDTFFTRHLHHCFFCLSPLSPTSQKSHKEAFFHIHTQMYRFMSTRLPLATFWVSFTLLCVPSTAPLSPSLSLSQYQSNIRIYWTKACWHLLQWKEQKVKKTWMPPSPPLTNNNMGEQEDLGQISSFGRLSEILCR